MTIQEATIKRVRELCEERKLSEYALIYLTGMPSSTVKSIMNGKSKNPGIANIKKIAEGLGISIREFYDSDIFDDLDPED
ncbi:helix-turn-helix domain-containing protein [Clostridium sp. MCC353]|uniref:helix-turn-helix domain-containing protein n=1 Tax=Clostridium sp. MCC353 TaxID=2592646 RepID=UPI001C00D2BE|nr:helix-turn-helix transcriptional regulator [Clostridium sp. MCC353]MBT9778816.1 helix-turn-helix domain-containing protein [Clostridium sp. MCC353]